MLSPRRLVSSNFSDVFGSLPSIVIWCGGDAPTSENYLTLDKHFFARRKDIAIGDHQIFRDRSVGYDDEQLIAEPDGVDTAKRLGPLVEYNLGIVGQRIEGTYHRSQTHGILKCEWQSGKIPIIGHPLGPSGILGSSLRIFELTVASNTRTHIATEAMTPKVGANVVSIS